MTEQQIPQDGAVWSQTTITDVARVLSAVAYELSSGKLTQGVRFAFADRSDIVIDIYPELHTLELDTGYSHVMLRRIAAPVITDDHVVIAQEAPDGQLRHFSITNKGEVTLIEVLSTTASKRRIEEGGK